VVDRVDYNQYRLRDNVWQLHSIIRNLDARNLGISQPHQKPKADGDREEILLLLLPNPSRGTSGTTNSPMK